MLAVDTWSFIFMTSSLTDNAGVIVNNKGEMKGQSLPASYCCVYFKDLLVVDLSYKTHQL